VGGGGRVNRAVSHSVVGSRGISLSRHRPLQSIILHLFLLLFWGWVRTGEVRSEGLLGASLHVQAGARKAAQSYEEQFEHHAV